MRDGVSLMAEAIRQRKAKEAEALQNNDFENAPEAKPDEVVAQFTTKTEAPETKKEAEDGENETDEKEI